MTTTGGATLMATYPPPPVTFVRGEGSWLWDDAGRRYLDFVAGLGVTSLGHAHPAVAAALAAQAATLLHVSNLYGTTVGPEVAATLDRLLGGGGRTFFCNSGAEANEAAIKLARKWAGPGRFAVVSAYGSFHGRTNLRKDFAIIIQHPARPVVKAVSNNIACACRSQNLRQRRKRITNMNHQRQPGSVGNLPGAFEYFITIVAQ